MSDVNIKKLIKQGKYVELMFELENDPEFTARNKKKLIQTCVKRDLTNVFRAILSIVPIENIEPSLQHFIFTRTHSREIIRTMFEYLKTNSLKNVIINDFCESHFISQMDLPIIEYLFDCVKQEKGHASIIEYLRFDYYVHVRYEKIDTIRYFISCMDDDDIMDMLCAKNYNIFHNNCKNIETTRFLLEVMAEMCGRELFMDLIDHMCHLPTHDYLVVVNDTPMLNETFAHYNDVKKNPDEYYDFGELTKAAR